MEHPYEKRFIPLMLDASSIKWLIIGGGTIATRKVNAMLKQDAAHIDVVAPHLSQELKIHYENKAINYIQDEYKTTYLEGAHIVYAATDDAALNKTICIDAKLLNILVCNVSEQEQGNFITPSFFQRDSLIFSISSQGKSPILTKIIADEWANYIDDRFTKQLPLLEKLRQDLKRDIQQPSLRQQILREATPQLLYDHINDYNKWYKSLLKHNL